jgi:2-dehydro-3-deoxyphosphogluconate aldolase/(4S)-4-hydroxy-2-oxoglutarate aldolase
LGRAALKERIIASGLIAVLRRIPGDRLVPLVEILSRGGVGVAEITWDDEGSLWLLQRAVEVSGRDLLWGMGTVTTVDQVRRAVGAGARFIVTPVLVPEVISACLDLDVLCIPGAFSPTEVYSAWRAGADLVKVFPACVLGPSYFQEMQGPFPAVPLVAVGGVDASNAGSFLRAGACAVAAGGKLVPRHLVETGQWSTLVETVSGFVAAVREGKGSCSR